MTEQPQAPEVSAPQPETVKAISAPIAQRPTVWAVVLAFALELPNLIDLVTPILSTEQSQFLHTLAVLAGLNGVLVQGAVAVLDEEGDLRQ